MIETILIPVLLSAVVAFLVSRQSSKQTLEPNAQKVITTENLIITDGDATPRMLFRSGPDGPVAILNDENGENRLVFGVNDSTGPTISMYDAKGTLQAQMSQQEAGYKFTLHDAEGKLRGVFGVHAGGTSLQFAGPDGKLRTLIGMDQGTSGLKVFNEKGDLRAELGYDAKFGDLNGAFLSMFDGDQKPRLEMNVGITGPTIQLSDEDGKIAAGLKVVKTVPVFALFDSENRPDPAIGALAFAAVSKAVREGRDQSEVNTIFQQTVKEHSEEHKPDKSVFIIPGLVWSGQKTGEQGSA
ncbi:hypothetical protein CLG94_03605 [Candidatus Methylomirabilis limnetica]|uniref:Uncharacterized protein n=1 Tax=Candidatus Methylomirabilis limnetica TaxID=2033718 RepID=A0A2T4TZB3_9BACT|nr:hypothetical protein [Candidatus Methylomirabilis limnetica]PTL36456.1 hypothetical protein CLG94_03605 [Candidatus Methylomirabilis limnetica]